MKWSADSTLIGRKYAHQHSKAMIPPGLLPSDIAVRKMPVIGMSRQPKKNTPWSIIRHFSHLSFLSSGRSVNPVKKVDNAIMP